MIRKKRKIKLFQTMPSLINEIKKNSAYKNITMSKVKFMQDRIVELGAHKKKTFLPFKEGIMKSVEEKEAIRRERQMRVNVGLLTKNKSTRRKKQNKN
ncbi:hypothetical protein THOM_3121 [Trachipleistophora hominis]|uniref:Uncharacterized protein n=1 Tax=Trachipleistophora hominis TaxID=72359 RepID=L7JSF1_TRAHO|nr:hypothetical protein THOM_3121 [Trachipleistophora hominis]